MQVYTAGDARHRVNSGAPRRLRRCFDIGGKITTNKSYFLDWGLDKWLMLNRLGGFLFLSYLPIGAYRGLSGRSIGLLR